jgi:lambda family phage portal protein
MRQVEADDLALRPFRGSQILTDFKASRERARASEAARAESARTLAAMRRTGNSRLRRQAGPGAQASAAEPAFGMVGGQRAFAASATDRLSANWSSVNTGINADLEMALATLRARSRDWSVNTDAGARYLDLVADNIVGSDPPRLQVRAKVQAGSDQLDEAANAAVEAAYARWCERGNCEVSGKLSFGEVCRLVAQTSARDGEALQRRLRDKRLPFGYALQMLDVDRIDSGKNMAPAVRGANAIRLGVEIDYLGRSQALHLHNRHPGDAGAGLGGSGISDRVPMDQLFHVFVVRREEQVRGYPWCAAILKRSNQLAAYEQWAIDAAKVGAGKMGFYKVDKDALDQSATWEQLKDATGELVQDVESGMLEALPPGVSFESFNPDYPHANFAPFVTEHKRDVAAGLSVAHHNLTGNMTGVNYSSARIAELSERRHWRALQRWLISSFVRPAFLDWLEMALLTRSIVLATGIALGADQFDRLSRAATFQPPGWDWVDPEADIKAAAIAATYDLRSLRAIADSQGVDLDDNLVDKAALRDRYLELKLPVPAWMSGGAPALATGAPPPQPTPAPAPEDNNKGGAA